MHRTRLPLILSHIWHLGTLAVSSPSPKNVQVVNAHGLTVEVVQHDSLSWPDMSDSKTAEEVFQKEMEAASRASVPNLACPDACSELGPDPAKWPVFSHPARISACNETMLLDLAIFSDIKDKDTKASIRACTADLSESSSASTPKAKRDADACAPALQVQATSAIRAARKGASPSQQGSAASVSEFVTAAGRQISNHIGQVTPATCVNNTVSFAYAGKVAMGFYGGSQAHRQGVSSKLLDAFLEHVRKEGMPDSLLVELCDRDAERGADYIVGIAASSNLDLPSVQSAVKQWSQGTCLTDSGAGSVTEVSLLVPAPQVLAPSNSTNQTSNWERSLTSSRQRLQARADCRTAKVNSGDGCWAIAQTCGVSQSDLTRFNPRSNFCDTLIAGETICCSQGTLPETAPPPNADGTCKTQTVVAGDSCGSLASKCGINPNDFTKYNPKDGVCANLMEGQRVCCGRGNLPDLRPKQNADGSCFVYETVQGDFCNSIAVRHGLTTDELMEMNKKTWGWAGCSPLGLGVRMCLSSGRPPMPAPIHNAICGPQVPGTQHPGDGLSLASLNPCPLKACCNIWGQCGTTSEFCTEYESPTGAPGTSAPGTSGCIFNCGTHIVQSTPRTEKINIAYFESWNADRNCLKMNVDQIDTTKYSHIHFAFVDITPGDFRIDVSKAQYQFELFKAMRGVKKIISFGGWEFSNSPGTYYILRQAVKPENRPVFRKNVVDFVMEHELDGVDLDWEYPGAKDIPGTPEGDPTTEGTDYARTLAQLRALLPRDKSVSFAAPASYWYLRNFPVQNMGAIVDYVVYMTYDLHGQWDAGNQWASPGCPSGNCLRNHVNMTETLNALSMITKAGVPSNKVVVGVTSYARSFHMSERGCTGETCTFTGDRATSHAKKGRCTDTAGYISNAELDEIISSNKGGNVQTWTSQLTNFIVYDDLEWAAYMDDHTKMLRAALYGLFSMAGTTDWAVDLQSFRYYKDGEESGSGGDGGDGGGYQYNNEEPPLEACDAVYTDLDRVEADADRIPSHCLNGYVVEALAETLRSALDEYDGIMRTDYDHKFGWFAKVARQSWERSLTDFYHDHMDEFYTCYQQRRAGDGWQNVTIACPPKHSPGEAFSIYAVAKDEAAVARFLDDKYHIDVSWTRQKVWRTFPCNQQAGVDCAQYGLMHGGPELRPDFAVPNPKQHVAESIDNLRPLVGMLRSTARDLHLMWSSSGADADVVDGAAVPVLMVRTAVENMKQVVEVGDKAEKEEITNIVTACCQPRCYPHRVSQKDLPLHWWRDSALVLSDTRSNDGYGHAGDHSLGSHRVMDRPLCSTASTELFPDSGGFTKPARARISPCRPRTLGSWGLLLRRGWTR
ncbi:hypothetical protein MAPG_09857 [Magnaporthiopsis poae ATCC 64411]|uniref:chitinase n=1 Tax=Magnaporthiopsis poae (strain ATCC 64411 / 73-15) TaxID=644358 RepID=A0A0C4EB16_MAGP6|nr:hypothetical protein MAPG_09857 [Magnaporthiopsis poae ATCC 64411]